MLTVVVFVFVLAVVGILLVACPRLMWDLKHSWQLKDPDGAEPSDFVVAWYRLSGVLSIGIAILLVVLAVSGQLHTPRP